MKVDRQAPFPPARGVTQLMYVGDDSAVELATGKQSQVSGAELAAGAVAAWLALTSKGTTRLVSGGIAAVVALRALRR